MSLRRCVIFLNPTQDPQRRGETSVPTRGGATPRQSQAGPPGVQVSTSATAATAAAAAATTAGSGEAVKRIRIGNLVVDGRLQEFCFEVEKGREGSDAGKSGGVRGNRGGGDGRGEGRPADAADHAVAVTRCVDGNNMQR